MSSFPYPLSVATGYSGLMHSQGQTLQVLLSSPKELAVANHTLSLFFLFPSYHSSDPASLRRSERHKHKHSH